MYGLIKEGFRVKTIMTYATDDNSLVSNTSTERHDWLNLTKQLSQGFIGRAGLGIFHFGATANDGLLPCHCLSFFFSFLLFFLTDAISIPGLFR